MKNNDQSERPVIFQKKIIIGSVVGFIATALGIIALFFPSLLNLEKEKITASLIMDINTMEDAYKLAEFLQEQITDDPKIFQLNVMCCSEMDNGVTLDNSEGGTTLTFFDPEQGFGYEIVFSGSFMGRWYRSVDTDRCELMGGNSIEGYFLSLGYMGTHQGYTSIAFTGIPFEQIKLKNY